MRELIYKPNLAKRIVATLLDYAIFLIPTWIYIMYFGYDNDEGGKTVSGLMALPIPLFWFLYFVVVEASYGATFCTPGTLLKSINKQTKSCFFCKCF